MPAASSVTSLCSRSVSADAVAASAASARATIPVRTIMLEPSSYRGTYAGVTVRVAGPGRKNVQKVERGDPDRAPPTALSLTDGLVQCDIVVSMIVVSMIVSGDIELSTGGVVDVSSSVFEPH